MDGASTARLAWITQRCPDVLVGAGFLYRRGQLLARSADVPRIRAVARRRISKVEKLDMPGFTLARLADGVDAVALAEEVAERHGEPLATPNHVFCAEAAATSDVRAVAYGGGLPSAPETVPYLPPPVPIRGRARSPRVAVLDTGWVLHRWLWRIPANLDLDPAHAEEHLDLDGSGLAGHGVFTAGLVLRACPEARIVFRRVLDDAGMCDEIQLAAALTEVARAPEGVPDVVLVPAGGYAWRDRPSPVLAAALATLPMDIAVVAAAGNAGVDDRPFWPAAEAEVVAVGALATDGGPAPFSNRGDWMDAATLGVDVGSAFPYLSRGRLGDAHVADGYARWSGTSFAAALVAGTIAARVKAKGQSGADAARSVLAAAAIERRFGSAVRRIPIPTVLRSETPEQAYEEPAYDEPGSDRPGCDNRACDNRACDNAGCGNPTCETPASDNAACGNPACDDPGRDKPACDRRAQEQRVVPGGEDPTRVAAEPEPVAPAPLLGPITRGYSVSVGFAPADLPDRPLPRRRSLEPDTGYLFWFELGQSSPRDRDPVRVAVVLARVDGELAITRDAADGEIELRSDGGVTVTRQPSGQAGPHRLYFPVRTPSVPGTYRLRCSVSHGESLLQSLLVEVRVGAPRWSVRPAVSFTVDYRAPGE